MALKKLSLKNPFLKMLLILSVFVFAAAFLPVAGFISFIFLPALTFSYSAVTGKLKTVAAFLIPVGLTFLLSNYFLQIYTPYLVILMMGIVGITISTVALKEYSIEKTVSYPALIIIGTILVFFIYSGWELSLTPWKLVQQFINKAIEQNINLYARLPVDREEINFLKNNKAAFISIFTHIFPVLVVIGALLIVWFNVLMGRNILRGKAIFLPKLEGLSRWRPPEFNIWIFITSGGLLLLPNEQIHFFSLNVFILTSFLYLLQGFAIISFIFQNKNVPVFLRCLFYFLIAVQQILMIPILFAGLFDVWVDFRRFFQKDQTVV